MIYLAMFTAIALGAGLMWTLTCFGRWYEGDKEAGHDTIQSGLASTAMLVALVNLMWLA